MYSSKLPHSKADMMHNFGSRVGYLHQGDKYVDSQIEKNERWAGKQFAVNRKPKPFSPHISIHRVPGNSYASDPYTKPSPFPKFQKPPAFGSADAAKRDEYSNERAVIGLREKIRKENRRITYDGYDRSHQARLAGAQVLSQQERANNLLAGKGWTLFDMQQKEGNEDRFAGKNKIEVGKKKFFQTLNHGPHWTTNSEVGETAHTRIDTMVRSESYATPHATKDFYDHNSGDAYGY
eukprot:g5121.t1